MPSSRLVLPLLMVGSLSATTVPVMAYQTGDLLVRGRLINISPDSSSKDVTSNGTTVPNTSVEVGDAYSLDIDFTYMFSPNLGAELLLDTSSKHDVTAKGSTLASLAPGNIMSTRVLPPALILQYHPMPGALVSPYVGLGLNYTYFFDKKATDSLNKGLGGVTKPSLDGSFGWVAQFGADYNLGNEWFLNADVKYMAISTTAEFNSGALGSVSVDVDINPWVIGFGVGKRF
jgi:outer membrane protein